MVMRIVLAADMHLKPGVQNEQNKKLKSFLQYCSCMDRLFLIGDTFNCWFENRSGYAGDYSEIIDIFAEAVTNGLQIIMLNGNRDFVFGNGKKTPLGFRHCSFQRYFNNSSLSALSQIGVYLQGENAEFTYAGKKYYLIHGDSLCTEDIWHQLLRYLLAGNPGGRFLSSFIPLKLADLVFSIGKFYNKDAYNNVNEIPYSRQVQDEAVIPYIDAGVDIVICGHLHKHIEKIVVGSKRTGQVIVLPCWASGDYALLDNDKFQIKKISCG